MELNMTCWLLLSVVVVLFMMWVYTLKTDNDKFKAIIDKYLAEPEAESFEEPKEKKKKRRTFNPEPSD